MFLFFVDPSNHHYCGCVMNIFLIMDRFYCSIIASDTQLANKPCLCYLENLWIIIVKAGRLGKYANHTCSEISLEPSSPDTFPTIRHSFPLHAVFGQLCRGDDLSIAPFFYASRHYFCQFSQEQPSTKLMHSNRDALTMCAIIPNLNNIMWDGGECGCSHQI